MTAAYLFAGRHQQLVPSYQATARQLELLVERWKASGKTDKDKADRDQFIQACENVISVENSSWMAQWVDTDKAQG